MLLECLNGELAGVPWVVAWNVSLSCGSGLGLSTWHSMGCGPE